MQQTWPRVQGPSLDSPPQQVAEGQALRLSQWHSIWLLLRTEIACFFRGPLNLSLCCDDNTIAPTGTPPGKGSLCLLNPSFIVGYFQMTTSLQRLFLSLLCPDCRKQTQQLVFKGEKEIRTDSEVSSPAWHLGFWANAQQRPANRFVDLTARQELGIKCQLRKIRHES